VVRLQGDNVNKFSKIIFVYLSPCFALLLFSDFASVEKRFRPGVFDRVFSIYLFAGMVVIPILVFGLPSVASIKAGILSDRVRQAVKRKFQTVSISLALVLIVGLTQRVVPPRDAMSLIINIVVFLTMFSFLVWSHFGRKSD
jgi:hypothetical protein